MSIHFLGSGASGCTVFALEHKHTNNECFSPHPCPILLLSLSFFFYWVMNTASQFGERAFESAWVSCTNFNPSTPLAHPSLCRVEVRQTLEVVQD